MKKNVVSRLAILASGAGMLALSACAKSAGDTAQAVKQSVQEPSLMKTWEGECKTSGLIDLSTRTFFVFAGSEAKEVHSFYENADCAGPIAVDVSYTGTFEFKDKTTENLRPIDLKFDEAYVKAITANGKEALDKLEFCSVQQWPINEAQKVTDKTSTPKCPLRKMPQTQYNLFTIENDTLTLGKYGWLDNKTVADDRPNKLDTSVTYKPSKRVVE